MKSKGCSRWLFLLGLLALIAICLGVVSLMYFQGRAGATRSGPLVLIHSPVNHEQARVGDGLLVHATARAGNGLRRIELWADDTFVDARQVTDGSAPTMLVFSGSWVPTMEGNHILVVRALASDGSEGQTTVTVEALAQEAADEGVHVVEEGETLETIAEEHGITPEELAAANPGLDPGGPAPGDELVIPDDEAPPADGGAPAEAPPGSEPPVPEDDPPGAPGSAWDFPLLEPLRAFPFGAGEPTGLRVEFLSLLTYEEFEQLHCYIGYADVPPRWVPDSDGDQTTDESFVIEEISDRAVRWSVAGLSGDSMPVFYWPRNLDLPLSVTCVGITAGGTEAVELGTWEHSAPSDRWTGVVLASSAGALGAEAGWGGRFDFTFRITRTDGGRRGVPLWLDPDMTPPTNVRLDDRRISLRWDYNPRPDEEPIDGFRVYLNGSLQWVEPADSRESGLPYEWFNPPCGTTYTFGVTAYRAGLPDGPESFPDIAILGQPEEDCTREVLLTFLTLETFDLGGDGRYEDRHGDVGPAYGYFYANESQITFSGGHLGPGLDMPNGLRHNTLYNLGEMSADRTWRFSGMPALTVAIPEDGAFEFGFHIMDEDSGRCNDSGDAGCDDLICEGFSPIYEVNSANAWMFDSHNEGALISEDGRCRVTYQWGPAAGSPVGSGVAGWEPLPWITLEDFVVNEDSGQVQIHVRNTGTATWPWRDLNVELQTRDGISLGVYTWPMFMLEPGQRAVLEHPDMRLSAPFDACVVIDPYDDVLEALERSGAMTHTPICPQVPDLVVTDVRYYAGQISVTIQNIGEAMRHRAVSVQTYLPDGAPLYIGGSYPDITLGRRQTVTLNFGGVSESIREQMRNGYQVTVNPDRRLFESDTSNNTFRVPAANSLMISVMGLRAPWDYRNSAEFSLTAYAVSGSGRRQVADLHFTDIDWDSCTRTSGCSEMYLPPDDPNSFSVYWFPIFGDEALEVIVHVTHRDGDWTLSDTYLPRDNWNANGWGSTRGCSDWLYGTRGWHPWTVGSHDGQPLGLTFQVCQQSP